MNQQQNKDNGWAALSRFANLFDNHDSPYADAARFDQSDFLDSEELDPEIAALVTAHVIDPKCKFIKRNEDQIALTANALADPELAGVIAKQTNKVVSQLKKGYPQWDGDGHSDDSFAQQDSTVRISKFYQENATLFSKNLRDTPKGSAHKFTKN